MSRFRQSSSAARSTLRRRFAPTAVAMGVICICLTATGCRLADRQHVPNIDIVESHPVQDSCPCFENPKTCSDDGTLCPGKPAPPQNSTLDSAAEVGLVSLVRNHEDADESTIQSEFCQSESCNCCEWPRQRVTFGDDFEEFRRLLRDDSRGLANWKNATILGVALAGALAMRPNFDDDIRANTARHNERWGDGAKVLGKFGRAEYHIPAMLALYSYGLKKQDGHLRQLSGSLLSAYTINGLGVLAIKGIVNTDRPSDDWNGGQFGFPSFHAASSFTIASVLDEYYGLRVGLPAYALAGLVGWSRIDERDHDLSDVVFGAAVGYVIGHSVANRHLTGDSRVRLLPYHHPTEGASGVMIEIPF